MDRGSRDVPKSRGKEQEVRTKLGKFLADLTRTMNLSPRDVLIALLSTAKTYVVRTTELAATLDVMGDEFDGLED